MINSLMVLFVLAQPAAGSEPAERPPTFCHEVQASEADPADADLDLLVAVFTDLIDRYGEADGYWSGPIFFLRLGTEDPSDRVVESVSELWPDVRPASDVADMRKERLTEVQSKAGEPGVVLFVAGWKVLDTSTAVVCAGVYKGVLASRTEEIHWKRKDGAWVVDSIQLAFLS